MRDIVVKYGDNQANPREISKRDPFEGSASAARFSEEIRKRASLALAVAHSIRRSVARGVRRQRIAKEGHAHRCVPRKFMDCIKLA